MFCSQCGTQGSSGAKFCAKCGTEMTPVAEREDPLPATASSASEREVSDTNGYNGVRSGAGGWLLLIVIGMTFLGPLAGAVRLNESIAVAQYEHPEIRSLAEWKAFKTFSWMTLLGGCAVSVFGGWGLMRGTDWSVVDRAKIVLWICGPAVYFVMGIVVPLATVGKSGATDPQFFVGLLVSVLAAGIWTAYLSKSKRVRKTYRRSTGPE